MKKILFLAMALRTTSLSCDPMPPPALPVQTASAAAAPLSCPGGRCEEFDGYHLPFPFPSLD